MKMCNEMHRLRSKLSKRGIPWEDKSNVYTTSPIDVTIGDDCEENYKWRYNEETEKLIGGEDG